eukprot:12453425-Alexandrium_andersonii.AAC.1
MASIKVCPSPDTDAAGRFAILVARPAGGPTDRLLPAGFLATPAAADPCPAGFMRSDWMDARCSAGSRFGCS